jgi:hypothetical protein
MKKKIRRRYYAIIEEMIKRQKKEIVETLELQGRVELKIDLGDGESISLGVFEREK